MRRMGNIRSLKGANLNPEILKEIVNVINGLGQNAKEGFVAYLSVAYGVDLLKFVIGCGLGVVLANKVGQIIMTAINAGGAGDFMRSVRDTYNIGSSRYMNNKELVNTQNLILKALAAYNTKEQAAK